MEPDCPERFCVLITQYFYFTPEQVNNIFAPIIAVCIVKTLLTSTQCVKPNMYTSSPTLTSSVPPSNIPLPAQIYDFIQQTFNKLINIHSRIHLYNIFIHSFSNIFPMFFQQLCIFYCCSNFFITITT